MPVYSVPAMQEKFKKGRRKKAAEQKAALMPGQAAVAQKQSPKEPRRTAAMLDGCFGGERKV